MVKLMIVTLTPLVVKLRFSILRDLGNLLILYFNFILFLQELQVYFFKYFFV